MLGGVPPYPGGRGREAGVATRIGEIGGVSGSGEQLGGAPFHVVGPGFLAVAIRRAERVALLEAFVGVAQGVDRAGGLEAPQRVSLIPGGLEDPVAEGKGGSGPPGQVGDAGGLAL